MTRIKVEPTRHELRMQLAKDVIAQLSSGKSKATCGLYLEAPTGVRSGMRNIADLGPDAVRWGAEARLDGRELRDVVKAKACSVCAIGALCYAAWDYAWRVLVILAVTAALMLVVTATDWAIKNL